MIPDIIGKILTIISVIDQLQLLGQYGCSIVNK